MDSRGDFRRKRGTGRAPWICAFIVAASALVGWAVSIEVEISRLGLAIHEARCRLERLGESEREAEIRYQLSLRPAALEAALPGDLGPVSEAGQERSPISP